MNGPALNHVAITMMPELLDEAGRAELVDFYGEVFGWTEGELDEILGRAEGRAQTDDRVRIIAKDARTTHGPTHDDTLPNCHIGFLMPLMVELQHIARDAHPRG